MANILACCVTAAHCLVTMEMREAFILSGQSYASPSELAFSLGQARLPASSMKDDNMFIADKVYAYRQLGFYEKLRSLQGVLEAFIFLTSTYN